jgi:hypothetical protein
LEGYAKGQNEILDSSYKPTTSVQSGDGLIKSDMHEAVVIPDLKNKELYP